MRRIKLVFAVGAVMVAMLALNAGSAMADDLDFDGDLDCDGRGGVEEVDTFSGEVEVECENGDEFEFSSGLIADDIFDNDIFDNDIFDDGDDDHDNDGVNNDNEREVVHVIR